MDPQVSIFTVPLPPAGFDEAFALLASYLVGDPALGHAGFILSTQVCATLLNMACGPISQYGIVAVEDGVEILEEQEPAEGGDHQGDRRQHDDDEQVDECQAEGEPAARSEVQAARAEGLAGDESVVVDGQLLLSDGTRVEPRNKKAGA